MGPSKEELSNYFKNNRKYFDELAKHYKISDPEYYEKFIAPFYSGVFSSTGGKKGVQVRPLALGIFLVALGIGIVTTVVSKKSSVNKSIITEEQLNDLIENTKIKNDSAYVFKSNNPGMLDSLEAIGDMMNFSHGEFLYKMKKYNEAEEYLKKVPEKCPKYNEAQDLLKEIKKLKKGRK